MRRGIGLLPRAAARGSRNFVEGVAGGDLAHKIGNPVAVRRKPILQILDPFGVTLCGWLPGGIAIEAIDEAGRDRGCVVQRFAQPGGPLERDSVQLTVNIDLRPVLLLAIGAETVEILKRRSDR
jgi:hypothetical protein